LVTNSLEVAATVKEVNKTSQLPYLVASSSRPTECLHVSDVDFVVVGEPENTISELVEAIEQGKQSFNTIKGLGFRENGKPILTDSRHN